MYENLKKEIAASQEEIIDLEKKLEEIEKEQKEYEERYKYSTFEEPISKERKRDIARIKELISEERKKIYIKERTLKVEDLKQSLEKNNNTIREIDTRIETINKMMEDVKSQDFSSINETLKNISDLLSIALKEREKLVQENSSIMGSIRYLNFNSEVQEENLYDRLWKNALKENEKRDAAEFAETEEERKKESLSAHAYAMNNARWNATPIKNEYNEALHQYESYLRNEISKLLGIEAYEGIEEINPDNFELDNQQKERFFELKEEIYKLNNKTTGYKKQLMPKFAEEPEKLSDNQTMQSNTTSVAIPEEEITEKTEEKVATLESKDLLTEEELNKYSELCKKLNLSIVPFTEEETESFEKFELKTEKLINLLEQLSIKKSLSQEEEKELKTCEDLIKKVNVIQAKYLSKEKLVREIENLSSLDGINHAGNLYLEQLQKELERRNTEETKESPQTEEEYFLDEEATITKDSIKQEGKTIDKKDEIEKGIKRAEEKGKELLDNIKAAATDDVMEKILAATSKEKEKTEEKEAATDNVMEKIIAATSNEKEKPEEKEATTDNVMEKILAATDKEKEHTKEEETTAIVPVEAPIEEKEEPQVEEQEVKGVRKPKSKKKLRKSLYVKIAALIAGIVVLASIGAYISKKNHPKTPPIAIENPESENKDDDIVIISNGGIPVAEETENTKEDLDYIDDDEKIPAEVIKTEDDDEKIPTETIQTEAENEYKGTKPITPSVNQQALIDSGIITNSGENEQEVLSGTGLGIKPEDLQYYDEDIHFEQSDIPGVSHIIETQDDGETVGMKNIPTDRIPSFIESVSKQTNQAQSDLYERYMPGTSVTAPQTSTNTEVKVTPQKEVLRQAIIDSGAMQTSANDEYSAMMNQGQGIKSENLKYWYDQGNVLEFFKNSATGSYEVIEPQKDGSKKILGWWTFDAVERYIESIAKNTDADFNDLFEKQTGENYLEELDSLNTKGASR